MDSDGNHIKGKWGDCGPDCPTEDDIWLADETLAVTPTDDEDNWFQFLILHIHLSKSRLSIASFMMYL